MSVPQRYGITFPFDGIPLVEQREIVREVRRPRLHRHVVGGVGRLRRVHPARRSRRSGRRAALRHRDRAGVHARRAHARVDGRVDVPGRARPVRARHRHVVGRDRRTLERHPVREAVPARARHDPLPARRAHGREGRPRSTRRSRSTASGSASRCPSSRRSSSPRCAKACCGSRAAKATARSSTGSRPTT